jgi:surface polysaccharide O-acyltransferase-like enzyme
MNKKLNFLKAIACFMVVIAHIRFPGLFGDIIWKATAYSVPIFLMIAGYFSFGKKTDTIKRRLKQIAFVFLWAYASHFIFGVTKHLIKHDLLTWLAEKFTWKSPFDYILWGYVSFASPLWYLIIMVEVYAFWYFVVRAEKERLVLRLLPLLLVTYVGVAVFIETADMPWYYCNLFFVRGLSFFLLGYYLRTEEAQKLLHLKRYQLILLTVFGFTIIVTPTTFGLPIKFGDAGLIPCVLGLFALALQEPEKGICRPLEFIGDKLSLYIYVFHLIIGGNIILKICNFLHVSVSEEIYAWFRPVLAVIMTTIFSAVLYYGLEFLKKRKPLRA